jgi:hypothetical protein
MMSRHNGMSSRYGITEVSAMDKSPTSLERAFALAKSGACTSVDDLKRCLRLEGYQINQIVGSTLARQLRTLIAEARGLPIPAARKGQKRRADAIGGEASAEVVAKTRRSEIARNPDAKGGSKTP